MCDDAQLPSAPWRPLSGSCYAKYWKYTHLLFRFLFHRRVVVAAATFTGTQPSALAFSGWWVVQGDGWWVVDNTGWFHGGAPNTAYNLELAVREAVVSLFCLPAMANIWSARAGRKKYLADAHKKYLYPSPRPSRSRRSRS